MSSFTDLFRDFLPYIFFFILVLLFDQFLIRFVNGKCEGGGGKVCVKTSAKQF